MDACDNVMEKMGYPKKLISFTTERRLEGGKTKVFRLKSVGYGLALVVLSGLLVLDVLFRVPLELDIVRDRNTLYRENQQGFIENVYQLRIINKSQQAQVFEIDVHGIDDLQYIGPSEVSVAGGEVYTQPVTVAIDPYFLDASLIEIDFTVTSTSDASVQKTTSSNFLSR